MGDSLTTSDYNYENQEEITPQSAVIFRFMYVAVYSITIFLGILLNTIVIFMAKKDKFQSGKTLILSLAVTHLVFCLFLPFNLISAWQEFTWKFGDEACKLVSYVRIVNMFSVSMMITFWKMDWCCSKSYEKHMVLLSWVIGVILSIPSLLYREVQDTADGKVCLDKYDTTEDLLRMTAVMCCRLIFGLLLPLVVTCFNCFKKNNKKLN
ncbi:chemokine-like receptor 1 [Esox lucius]|uniref:chemokine-like receptor 1 n=1 Tax=Esox lucius TaxID=8010 RepID=UPI001476A6DA|nr:chemokine-like receptor 1 [Esox lucius]